MVEDVLTLRDEVSGCLEGEKALFGFFAGDSFAVFSSGGFA